MVQEGRSKFLVKLVSIGGSDYYYCEWSGMAVSLSFPNLMLKTYWGEWGEMS